MSGLDLFRYVSYMYLETRFVLITGCDDLRIKRESMRLGIQAYIEKPFYFNELLQTIINLMQRDDQKEVPAT
jgi:FixJ family two-component response regulator